MNSYHSLITAAINITFHGIDHAEYRIKDSQIIGSIAAVLVTQALESPSRWGTILKEAEEIKNKKK